LWVNKAAGNSVNKQPKDMAGQPCYSFWGDPAKPCVNCPTLKAFQTKQSEHVIVETPDGRIWDEGGEPVFDSQGNVVAVVEIAQDITKQKTLQAQLQQAQRMESVGILAGGVAHEFNNMLQSIIGYNSLILLDKTENDKEYQSLSAIQKTAQRAAVLVKQLLLYSRKVEFQRHPLELNQEVEEARRILERTIPKMIDIGVHLGSRLWTVLADPIQIGQILLNLGNNAADAMPDGGRLFIQTENISLGDDYVSNKMGAVPGNYVLLTVSDTGCGMDRKTIQHIFDPFFTTKGIGKGTGLGLASVYGIVKGHGGYITCYSEVGQGTTFKIYLPVVASKDIPEDQPSERPSLIGGSETILLADDEEAIRGFASAALQRFGYTVITAVSGEGTLEKLIDQKSKIDLVILDIGMPGMGGHRCLSEILKIDPAAKVMIVSGYSADAHVKKALEAGAAGYVGKPYQLNDLLNKVRSVLDKEE
ncbi:MAG: response regulator, partial [Deltaproteobacteria bacterium]|nr:response regulator [Deltaproteobacteria bacterium]